METVNEAVNESTRLIATCITKIKYYIEYNENGELVFELEDSVILLNKVLEILTKNS